MKCCRLLPLLLLLCAGLLAGCGDSGNPVQIDDVREVPRDRADLPPDVSPAVRFGLARQRGPHGGTPQPTQPKWSWTTPEGWQETGGGGMRVVGFKVAGDPTAECTVIVLGGTGGGLAANVNRWRKQMGLDALDAQAVSALPRKPVLGKQGVFVDFLGTYGGMGSRKPLEGARMLGIVHDLGGQTLFVKLTGPAAVIDAERARFDAFAASLKMQAAPAAPPTAPLATPPARQARLSWTLPAGWASRPGVRMREASFIPAGSKKTECYIIILGGRAGGVTANVNLWRQQVGQGPLTEEAMAALERTPMLGGDGVLVEVKGAFRGKDGKQIGEAMLLGAIVERASDSVFVKMVGPASEVEPQKENFIALCKSLKE